MYYIIFLLPLIMSVVATVMVLGDDHSWLVKGLLVLFVGSSVAMQFVPALVTHVHFLVPLGMQIVVCLGWYFARLLEDV